jgi:hypothetical protein
MLPSIRKAGAAVALLGAFALGGAAIAGAAGTKTGSTAKPQRDALSGTTAAKVKAAALAKVPGATVLRTEAGGPYSTAYHAHVKTSDGTLKVVLVDKDFEATAVQADNGRHSPAARSSAAVAAAATTTSSSGALRQISTAATSSAGRRASTTTSRPSPSTWTAIRPAITGTTSTSSRPPAAAPSSTRPAATAPTSLSA